MMSVAAPILRNALVAERMPAERSFAFGTGSYQVRMATSESERLAAFRLRFWFSTWS